MKTIFSLIATFALALFADATLAQQASADTANASKPQRETASEGLADLERMTFGCPKAGLNAAARAAAKAPSQGSYQFTFFKIVNDAHHAFYEVHFKSNYQGEPDLKYCVSMYCQQGWDPRTSETEVTLMSDEEPRSQRRRSAKAHATCGHTSAAKKKRRS